MNIDTGKIEYLDDKKELKKRIKELKERMVQIDPSDMTEKQKKTLQVSLKDTRSKLGKKRHELKRRTSRRK